jgi:hypothetical protein
VSGKIRKLKQFKVVGAIKTKDLYRLAKLDHGHLCLREEK